MIPPAARRAALRCGLASFGLHALAAAVFLAIADFKPEYFVMFGVQAPSWPVAQAVLGPDVPARGGYGHDGKEFWLLARDPALRGGPELARRLDRPAYRAQRILYPALAAPWRLAGERALVWGLLATNLVAVGFGGYLAALLAMQTGAPVWAGMAFALNPAVFVTVIHDGCDVVALTALLSCLLLLTRGKTGGAVGAGALATLAKEASLLSLGGVALLAPGLSRRTRVLIVAVPVAAALAWGAYARWRLGWPETAIREFTPPFAGYVETLRRGTLPFGLLLPPLAGYTLWLWWRRRSLLLAAAVPYALIVPFLSPNVLGYTTGVLRAFGPGLTLLAIELLRGRGARRGTVETLPEAHPTDLQ
jgi:hypothetical protein